jgi:hypothetical protein
MILGGDGELTHTAAHRTAGIADGGAEKFRKGDERHTRSRKFAT